MKQPNRIVFWQRLYRYMGEWSPWTRCNKVTIIQGNFVGTLYLNGTWEVTC